MKTVLKQLKELFSKVSLSDGEKSEIRHLLLLEMDRNPVRAGGASRHHDSDRGWVRRLFSPLSLTQKPMPLLLLLAILVTGGGGTALAAEDSLPGDFLYSVKTEFNEEVRAAFLFNDEDRAQWEARRAERRLEEIERLASSDKLQEDIGERLSHRFEVHAARVEHRIEQLEMNGKVAQAADVSSRFEATLRAHEKILAHFEGTQEIFTVEEDIVSDALDVLDDDDSVVVEMGDRAGRSIHVLPALERVRIKIDSVSDARLLFEEMRRGEDHPDRISAAERARSAAKESIEEVRKLLKRLQANGEISEGVVVQVEEQLRHAEEVIEKGDAAFRSEHFEDAFTLYLQSLRIVYKAKALLFAPRILKVDIEFNGEKIRERRKDSEEKSSIDGVDVNGEDDHDDHFKTDWQDEGQHEEEDFIEDFNEYEDVESDIFDELWRDGVRER